MKIKLLKAFAQGLSGGGMYVTPVNRKIKQRLVAGQQIDCIRMRNDWDKVGGDLRASAGKLRTTA